MDEIISEVIAGLQQELFGGGIKASTVNRYMSVLSTLLADLERILRRTTSGPLIPKFKKPEDRLRYLSDSEEKEPMNYLRFTDKANMRWRNKGGRPRTVSMITRVRQSLEECLNALQDSAGANHRRLNRLGMLLADP